MKTIRIEVDSGVRCEFYDQDPKKKELNYPVISIEEKLYNRMKAAEKEYEWLQEKLITLKELTERGYE